MTPRAEEPAIPESGVPLTPPSQHQEAGGEDLCALCGEHLYILERVCADGRFYHRSCFCCHVCEATLWPGGYEQHPEDGEWAQGALRVRRWRGTGVLGMR